MKHSCPAVHILALTTLLSAANAAQVEAPSTGSGQAYPAKPLRMLTAEPGGGSDLAARLIAHGLSASLGQQVVVDNRVGGIIIAELAAKAPPDGYTLFTYSSTLWLIPLMRNQTPYDPLRDYSPITLVGSSPMVLVIHPSVVATSVRELIALDKAKPGELNFASGPSGAIPHLSAELFKYMADEALRRVDLALLCADTSLAMPGRSCTKL